MGISLFYLFLHPDYSSPRPEDSLSLKKIPMHKLLIRCIALAGVILLTTGCVTKTTNHEDTCYVSILPVRYIVQGIVGDDLKIKVLVPSGASPETFEPTPKQFVELNQARLIFNVGLIDFETTLLAKIQDQRKIVDLSHGIHLIEGTCAHAKSSERTGKNGEISEQDHDHAHGVDPHVWTSPKALKIMAKNVFEAIQKAYPDSVKYQLNYDRLMRDLDALDARVEEKIRQSKLSYFIVYHPALTYYARDYGIRQVAIENDGKEPSARQLAEIIRDARKNGIRRIFYQNQFPKSVVEIIAQDMQAEYIEIDPLDEQVIENIDRITDLITRP